MQNDYMLGWRYSKLILISAQRHQMISFPSRQTQSGAGIVYLPLSLPDDIHLSTDMHRFLWEHESIVKCICAFILWPANIPNVGRNALVSIRLLFKKGNPLSKCCLSEFLRHFWNTSISGDFCFKSYSKTRRNTAVMKDTSAESTLKIE